MISIIFKFNIFFNSCSLVIRPLLIFHVQHFSPLFSFLAADNNGLGCTIFIGFAIEIEMDLVEVLVRLGSRVGALAEAGPEKELDFVWVYELTGLV